MMIAARSEEEAREFVSRRGETAVKIEPPAGEAIGTGGASVAGPAAVAADGDPYGNLRGLGRGMVNFAKIFQNAGKIIAALCILVAFIPTLKDEGRIVMLITGIVAGFVFHGLGMCIAAMGEALHALADIASHTARIPEPEGEVSAG